MNRRLRKSRWLVSHPAATHDPRKSGEDHAPTFGRARRCPVARTSPHGPPYVVSEVTSTSPDIWLCGHCGFVSDRSFESLSEMTASTADPYKKAGLAPFGSVSDEGAVAILDLVVHVRDTLHYYASCLNLLASGGHPVLGSLDPEPIQPVGLEHRWGAVIGLVANIQIVSGAIRDFPSRFALQEAVVNGSSVNGLQLSNFAAHEAIHHLLDLQQMESAEVLFT
jgi:hypothetical protein